MRGRTLNDAFVILDEAQNSTSEQMKMFLTRLGFGSRAVITGDLDADRPAGRPPVRSPTWPHRSSKEFEGIPSCSFTDRDVVRHPLVQRIVQAYESHEPACGHRSWPLARSHARCRPAVSVRAESRRLAAGRARARAPGRAAALGRARGGQRDCRCCWSARRAAARSIARYRGRDHATNVLSFPAAPARSAQARRSCWATW